MEKIKVELTPEMQTLILACLLEKVEAVRKANRGCPDYEANAEFVLGTYRAVNGGVA